jgi:hypothetical protein
MVNTGDAEPRRRGSGGAAGRRRIGKRWRRGRRADLRRAIEIAREQGARRLSCVPRWAWHALAAVGDGRARCLCCARPCSRRPRPALKCWAPAAIGQAIVRELLAQGWRVPRPPAATGCRGLRRGCALAVGDADLPTADRWAARHDAVFAAPYPMHLFLAPRPAAAASGACRGALARLLQGSAPVRHCCTSSYTTLPRPPGGALQALRPPRAACTLISRPRPRCRNWPPPRRARR